MLSIFKHFTEGGQILAHSMRMAKQVVRISLRFALGGILVLTAITVYQIPKVHWYAVAYQVQASFSPESKIEVLNEVWEQYSGVRYLGESHYEPASTVIQYTLPYTEGLKEGLRDRTFLALSTALELIVCLTFLFIAFGFLRGRKKHISGAKVVLAWKRALSLKISGKASDIRIGKVPLVKGSEYEHMLVTGGTGSGKSTCFRHILDQLREKNRKALVIDTTGSYIHRYFDPKRDYILNPLDERSKGWHPWSECVNPHDFKFIAESIVPQSTSERDAYWTKSAASLLQSALENLQYKAKTSALVHLILKAPMSELAKAVEGTRAAAYIDKDSDRTAQAIRAFASTWVDCLDYLKDTEESFSIRKWVANEDENGWLFLSSKPRDRATVVPLISAWFAIALDSIKDRPEETKKQIWFVCDELASLNRLNRFESFVTEARKYGGCGLFALQSPKQLEDIYGRVSCETILSNCKSKLVFQETTEETGRLLASFFGSHETFETSEGISYGAHEMRDGVSKSRQQRTKPLLTPFDIRSLKIGEAYLSQAHDTEVCKVRIPATKL